MSYLVVDKGNTEWIWNYKPLRNKFKGCWDRVQPDEDNSYNCVELPKGTIKKLIGREMNWADEPYLMGESDVQKVTNDEGMVPVEKVKEWLNAEFYVKNIRRENSFGEVIYYDEVVSDFETMKEMFECFLETMEE